MSVNPEPRWGVGCARKNGFIAIYESDSQWWNTQVDEMFWIAASLWGTAGRLMTSLSCVIIISPYPSTVGHKPRQDRSHNRSLIATVNSVLILYLPLVKLVCVWIPISNRRFVTVTCYYNKVSPVTRSDEDIFLDNIDWSLVKCIPTFHFRFQLTHFIEKRWVIRKWVTLKMLSC